MDRVIALGGTFRSIEEAFAYDEVNPSKWQRNRRVVTEAGCTLSQYLPNVSATFAKLAGPMANDGTLPIQAAGNLGLGLALDEGRRPVISVEAAALVQLVLLDGEPSAPEWDLSSWAHGQCLVLCNPSTGWRGVFAEHRLWSSILLRAGEAIKTPYPPPVVRGWFPTQVLDDVSLCLGEAKIVALARRVAALGFDGAPDLVLYRPGKLAFVEVKSATDRLRDNQLRMLRALSTFEGVSCHICCAPSAMKRFASVMVEHESSEEEDC